MSAPPDPPDPRTRLRRDGQPEVFDARGGAPLAIGSLGIVAAIGCLISIALGVESPYGTHPALVAALALAVVVMGAGYVLSPRLVRRIVPGDGLLAFLPIGVVVPLDALSHVDWVQGGERGSVNRLVLVTRRPGLHWVPGRLLWVGSHLSLWLVGADGAAIHAALSDALGDRPRSMGT